MSSGKAISTNRRVVITGLGTVNPMANDVPGFWEALKTGRSAIREIRNVDLGDYHVRIGGEVDLPENIRDSFKYPKMIRRLDRYILMAHLAGVQALCDAKLNVEGIAARCGAVLGTGAGGILAHQENIGRIHEGKMHEVSPFYLISAIPSTGTAFFVQDAGLKGPIFSVNSACATGNHAFGLSAMLIKSGMADVMFAGGSEAPVNAPGLSSFGNISALSTRNDAPEQASRPFDADRDGFIMSEGAGALCLEELEHAQARGAKIYAELSGFGFTSDAHDMVAPHPEAEGAVRAIRAALEMAGLEPEDIDLVNAHGTSTPLGDRIESLALNTALGEHGGRVPVHSTKSMVGHLLGAASVVEAIAALMVFEENLIHATANHQRMDPEINLNVVTELSDGSGVNHILSNAFGFGGMNAVAVLSRYRG